MARKNNLFAMSRDPPHSGANIPPRLPLFWVTDAETGSSYMPFPGTSLILPLPKDEALQKKLVSFSHLLIGHMVGYEQQTDSVVIFPVGLLAKVEQIVTRGEEMYLTAKGQCRVKLSKFRKKGNYSLRYAVEASWDFLSESPLTQEDFHASACTGFLGKLGAFLFAVPEELRPPFLNMWEREFRALIAEMVGPFVDKVAAMFSSQSVSPEVIQHLRALLEELDVLRRLEKLTLLIEEIEQNPDLILKTIDVSHDTADKSPLDANPQNENPSSSPASEPHTRRNFVENLLNEIALREPSPPRPSQPKREVPGRFCVLDWRKPSQFVENMVAFFDGHLVGQRRAKYHIARKLVRMRQRLADPERSQVGAFNVGPTGSGKSEIIRVLADFLFDDRGGYTHVDCSTLQEKHQVSYFIGAPAGYIGYGDEQALSQWRLDRPHLLKLLRDRDPGKYAKTRAEIQELEAIIHGGDSFLAREKTRVWKRIQALTGYQPGSYLALVLFDEIEKAHPDLITNVLLKIIDDGVLQLQSGEHVLFRNAVLFFTSNIYGSEIMRHISGKSIMGIRPSQTNVGIREDFETRRWRETRDAVVKFYNSSPEFLGRIQKENIIVFHPFTEEELRSILEKIYLKKFLALLAPRGISVSLTDRMETFILREAQDDVNRATGARGLKSVFEKRVEDPVISILDQGGEIVCPGTNLWLDVREKIVGLGEEVVVSKEIL